MGTAADAASPSSSVYSPAVASRDVQAASSTGGVIGPRWRAPETAIALSAAWLSHPKVQPMPGDVHVRERVPKSAAMLPPRPATTQRAARTAADAAILSFNETLAMHPGVVEVVATSFFHPSFAVTYTAALLLRRISEVPKVAHIIFFDDALFAGVMRCLEHCLDYRVLWHVGSAVLNMSTSDKAQFPVARCARFVSFLLRVTSRAVEEVVAWGEEAAGTTWAMSDPVGGPGGLASSGRFGAWSTAAALARPITDAQGVEFLADCALKIFANLLSSSDETNAYLKAQYSPGLLKTLVMLRSSPSNVVADSAELAIQALHERDIESLVTDVTLHIVEGRALANRMRSEQLDPPPILGAAAVAAEEDGYE